MNIDEKEINNFDSFAHEWWNKRGPYKLIHNLTPLRLKYIQQHLDIKNSNILDIGCGGGILAEELTDKGAKVTGLDASKKTIQIAKSHAKEKNYSINYLNSSLEDHIKKTKYEYDAIVCFELIEHIPDQLKLIKDLSSICKKGGKVFLNNENSSGGLITKIFTLEHESATQMMSAIRALVPATNPITVNASSNSLVVTDTAVNMNRIAKLIGSLDGPRLGFNENYKAQNIPITDLAALVNRVTNEDKGSTNLKNSEHLNVFFVPIPRTNSMLIRGYEKTRVQFALKMAKMFDVPTTNPSNVHVVYLKNAEAIPLANTLKNLFESKKNTGKTNILSGSNNNKDLTNASKNLNPSELLPQTKSSFKDSNNSVNSVIFNGAVIQAEPNINAILVVASEPIFHQIKEVINMLDIRRAQVYIESLIVEISAEKAAEFGVQFQFLDGLSDASKQFFGGTNFSTGGGNLLSLLANPSTANAGLNVGVINGTINVPGVGEVANLGVLIRALESEGNANIIATPTLLTLDNEEAKITIGQNVPFVTGQFTSSATGNNPFQTVERKDVGTSLTIKPLITQGGTVKLKIFQEVSRVLDSELSTTFGTVSTTKRSIESTVLVEDEQFVVLGGLIQDQDSIGESKVPILGDIPVMGNLFKYENKVRRKTNLFVFLRPVVIRSEEDAKVLTMDRYKYLKGFENKTENESPFLPNFERPIVPSIINDDNTE